MIRPVLGSRRGILSPLGSARQRAGADWLPSDLAGLILWVDFSDATTLFTDAGVTPVSGDGDAIYQANDKSGVGNHLVQATVAKRPTYKVNIQNSLSIGRCDGGDAMQVIFAGASAQPQTIFTVHYDRAAEGTSHNIYNGIASGNRHQFYAKISDTPDGWQMYAGSALAGGTMTKNAWVITAATWNGASSALRVNAANIMSGDIGAHTLTGLTLAATYTGAAGYTDGDYGAVLVYEGALSAANITTVESYLNNKWSVF